MELILVDLVFLQS